MFHLLFQDFSGVNVLTNLSHVTSHSIIHRLERASHGGVKTESGGLLKTDSKSKGQYIVCKMPSRSRNNVLESSLDNDFMFSTSSYKNSKF